MSTNSYMGSAGPTKYARQSTTGVKSKKWKQGKGGGGKVKLTGKGKGKKFNNQKYESARRKYFGLKKAAV